MPIYKISGKKDGLQKYRVEVSYTAPDGKYKKHVSIAYGMQAAKDKENELSHKESKISQTYTVYDLYHDYLDHKEVRESTLAKAKSILENHVIPYEKKLQLKNLSKKDLLEWKKEIQNKSLSLRMKQNIFKAYSSMLNWAVKTDKLQKNLLSDLGNFKDVYFAPAPEKLRYYTADQFQQYKAAMLSQAKTLQDWCFYVFFSVAFYTGMRKGEINALRWNDINGNIIHVRRSVSQKIKGKSIVETPPKTKSSYRDLQIPDPLKKALMDHKKRLEKMDGWTDNWRVCGGPYCLSDTAIENHNKKYAAIAGLPHITIHEFRHTHASLLCNEGINIQEIARRLGHSNVQITWQTYSHLYPREEERAVSILNEIK